MNQTIVQDALNMLGMMGKDRITGHVGVIDGVCFDLYGCVQVIVRPTGKDKDGKLLEAYSFDSKRVEIMDDDRIMPVPDFLSDGYHKTPIGAADKPASLTANRSIK